MSTETTGSEPTGARTREPGTAVTALPKSIYARLERAPWFLPAVAAIPVVVSGAVLAPRWATRAYPTDADLVGTPASEKIKAPYDFEVVDDETTERLRMESEAIVRRVYDFDAELGLQTAKRIEAAFEAMAERRAAFVDENPLYAEAERLPRATRARLDQEMSYMLEEARPAFEALLGVALTPEEHALLNQVHYDLSLGRALSQATARAQAEPIIDRPSTLEPDAHRGITIQRVPDNGSEDRVITDVTSIADLKVARSLLPAELAESLPTMTPADRQVLAGLGNRLVEPNLTLNRAATEIAREVARLAVKPVKIAFKEGEVVIRDGERITARHLLIFSELSKGAGRQSIPLVSLGGGLLVLSLLLTGFGLGRRRGWHVGLESRDLLFLAALFCLALIAARMWLAIARELQDVFVNVAPETFILIIPFAAGAMITRMVLRLEIALLFAVIGSLVLGLIIESDAGLLIYLTVGSVVGATTIHGMSRRSDLFRAGLWVGAAQVAVALALQLFDARTGFFGYVSTTTAALVSGLLAAPVALTMTLVVEAVFGYTTDLKLLELANLNHPVLKELVVQAPGSYHHSIIVGALVEAAAEEIGANALLARVMAYYHDIGKGQNPAYFSENQRGGQNPHNKLKPSMSVTIIRRHVTDGLELARRYGLGEQIMAGIGEHHGTTLIQFFYNKAKENEDENNPVSEQDYRYLGRKPQSREAALVMLGDSVEAASRSLAEPTPARIQGLVNRIINLKFTDGQLERCDLTLQDLHSIAKAFTRILKSIYHERPEYPGVLGDLTGKKTNGDFDHKPAKGTDNRDGDNQEDRPDNIRRLGLDGR